jgi:hypothetical protein
MCIKLWPTPPGAATVRVRDLADATAVARPLAVLDVDGVIEVFLQGTEAEVEAQAERLGGQTTPGHQWPADPEADWKWLLRVPPALTGEGVNHLPDGWPYVAIHGVGEVRAASTAPDGVADLREWAESVGGHLVMSEGDPAIFDPWGTPPPGLEQQRRLIGEFDPARILNPGRLPGGI